MQEFKLAILEQSGNEKDFVTKTTVLGVFDFRAFLNFDLDEFPAEWDIDIFFSDKTFFASNWDKHEEEQEVISGHVTLEEAVAFLKKTKLYSQIVRNKNK